MDSSVELALPVGGAQLMWLIDWGGSIDGIYRLRRLKWYLRLIAWSSSILDGWLNWCDWSIDVINRLMSLIDWCGSISDWLNRCERSIYLPLKYDVTINMIDRWVQAPTIPCWRLPSGCSTTGRTTCRYRRESISRRPCGDARVHCVWLLKYRKQHEHPRNDGQCTKVERLDFHFEKGLRWFFFISTNQYWKNNIKKWVWISWLFYSWPGLERVPYPFEAMYTRQLGFLSVRVPMCYYF